MSNLIFHYTRLEHDTHLFHCTSHTEHDEHSPTLYLFGYAFLVVDGDPFFLIQIGLLCGIRGWMSQPG